MGLKKFGTNENAVIGKTLPTPTFHASMLLAA
jgi:hypothetical protein